MLLGGCLLLVDVVGQCYWFLLVVVVWWMLLVGGRQKGGALKAKTPHVKWGKKHDPLFHVLHKFLSLKRGMHVPVGAHLPAGLVVPTSSFGADKCIFCVARFRILQFVVETIVADMQTRQIYSLFGLLYEQKHCFCEVPQQG